MIYNGPDMIGSFLLFAFAVFLAPTVSADGFRDRLCDRVVNRFSNDQKMWERVNERVQNRFGYKCELPLWSNPPRWVEETVLKGSNVGFRVLDEGAGINLSERQSRRVRFADNEDEWKRLWHEIVGFDDGVTLEDIPQINFASELTVAFLDFSETGGYLLKVKSVIELPQEFIIDVDRVIPWRCGITVASESQHAVIAIPRTGSKAIRVRFFEKYSICNEKEERISNDWREPPQVTGLARNDAFRTLKRFTNLLTSVLPHYSAVSSRSEFASEWNKWLGFKDEIPELPSIDKDNEQAVFISGGKGSSVDVRRVMELHDTIRIDALATFNACRTGDPEDTQQVIVIPQKGKRVRVVWEEVHIRSC